MTGIQTAQTTHYTGVYDLEVMNPAREVLYKGVVGVKAAPVAIENAEVTMPEGGTRAGRGRMEMRDECADQGE